MLYYTKFYIVSVYLFEMKINKYFNTSVSNNIIFQIFQKCFQNVELFSINPIKSLNVYADS